MKKVFLILALISNVATAQTMGMIYPSKNLITSTTITWKFSDNVPEACNAERKRWGEPAYQVPSRACAFWTKDTCLIITARETLPESLAHEVLHCFQGKWH
jgi:hypothetical protein